MHGVMHGGQNPVAGATVTLYAAGFFGFEGEPFFVPPTLLATTTTDNNGNYSIDSFTCPPNPFDLEPPMARSSSNQRARSISTPAAAGITNADGSPETYIVATGGNSGSGSNSAIAMFAAIGPCDQIQNSTLVNINELTTIAGEWALQQFSDSSGQDFAAPIEDLGGLDNAYDTAANLVDMNSADLSVSGKASSFLPSAAQCGSGSPPVNCDGLERLNTLADIIAACVNSGGPSSTACATLFCDATPGDTYSGTCSGPSTITDTLQAAYSIAQNPTNNVADLLALAMPNAPFEPTLGSTPDGWEIALNYTPAGAAFDGSVALALDAGGNVFVANSAGNSVSELPVAASYATGLDFAPSGAVFSGPNALAIDRSSNVFVANFFGSSVSELVPPNYGTSGSNFAPSGAALSEPVSLALDDSGNIFAANYTGNSVSELTSASSYATGSNFAPAGAAFSQPVSLALDESDNIFVANFLGNSVSELMAPNYGTSGFNFDNTTDPGAAFDNPSALALDSNNNIFVTNSNGDSVSELTQASSYATGLNFAPGGAAFNGPLAIAIDGLDNVFVANGLGNTVSELTESSNYATGFNFAPPGASFAEPTSLAVDASGNIFVANNGGNSVSELIGLGVPVPTPTEREIFGVGGAGRAGDAILVFLCLMTLWYGRKFLIASRKRTA